MDMSVRPMPRYVQLVSDMEVGGSEARACSRADRDRDRDRDRGGERSSHGRCRGAIRRCCAPAVVARSGRSSCGGSSRCQVLHHLIVQSTSCHASVRWIETTLHRRLCPDPALFNLVASSHADAVGL